MNQSHHKKKLKVAVTGDIHVRETSRGSFEATFAEINTQADILILCGDITNTGSLKEAEHLAHDLRICKIPVLAVLGNHDHHHDQVAQLKEILKNNIIFLEDETFEKDGVNFVGTKGYGGGFNAHVLSSFGENATKAFVLEAVNEELNLENNLRSLTTNKTVVVLHYAPIEATVVGEPKEIYPFLGCSRLAEAIDRHPVSLVVHGHVHHGQYEGKTTRGTPVYNCSLDVLTKKFNKPYVIFEV